MTSFYVFTGGYKGYGLSMMVELFCGILADGNWVRISTFSEPPIKKSLEWYGFVLGLRKL